MSAIHMKVRGVVQGVYFRESTRIEATRLGLVGWVRNTDDGAVELVAEGEPAALEQLVRWCHRGPPSARVDAVECSDCAATGELREFSVRRGPSNRPVL